MVQASDQVYVGDPERLASFRAGQAVSMCAWDVPESARGGERKECLTWRPPDVNLCHTRPASSRDQGRSASLLRDRFSAV